MSKLFFAKKVFLQFLFQVLPANLPSGIWSSIGFALAGSDHPNLPISVNTTVGLTAFTLICKESNLSFIM